MYFFGEVTFPDSREHLLRNFSVQPAYTVYFLRSVAGKYRHTETFALVTRIVTSKIHQVVPADTHSSRITTHVLTEQTFVEVVVTGRNRSMNCIKRRSANQLDSLIKCQSGSYIVADTLNIDQCSVSFVTMINVFFDAQCFQCQDTTDTQQDFLFQTVFPVATIKLMSNRTVELAVHFIICIQQIQRNTSYIYTPYVSMYIIIQIRNIHHQRLTIRIHHTVDRKLAEVLRFVVGNLLPIHRQRLSKVTVTIQETYRTKIYIAVRSFFQVVTGQYTQTTGIYFQDAAQTIFHAEISYRRTVFIRLHIHVISEFCINIIHSPQNHLVFCQRFQLLIAHTFQQQHRVLATFFPKFRI